MQHHTHHINPQHTPARSQHLPPLPPAPPAPTQRGRAACTGILCLLIALASGWYCGTQTLHTWDIQRTYHPVTGNVTHLEKHQTHRRHRLRTIAQAHYRFTIDHRTYSGKEPLHLSTKSAGDPIPILYNPENPAENCPAGLLNLRFIPALALIIFALFLTVGIARLRHAFQTPAKNLAPNRHNNIPQKT